MEREYRRETCASRGAARGGLGEREAGRELEEECGCQLHLCGALV